MSADPAPTRAGWLLGRQGLAGAATLVFLSTALAKLFGFLRDVVVASRYGASEATDAFYVAQLWPAILSTTIGYSLSIAVVSAAARVRAASGEDALGGLFRALLSRSTALAVLLGGAVALAAGPVIRFTAPDLSPVSAVLAVDALRWMCVWTTVHIFIYTATGVFQARRQFGPPALTTLIDAGVTTGVLAVAATAARPEAMPLAWCAGSVAAAGVLAFLLRGNIGPRAAAPPALDAVWTAVLPVAAANLLASAQLAVDRHVAAGLGEGCVTAVNYAALLVNVPVYFLAVPLGTASMPFLSVAGSGTDGLDGLRPLAERLGRLALLLLLPVSAYVACFSEEIVGLAYRRGAFDAPDAALTAQALLGYAPAPLLLGLALLSSRALYSAGRGRWVAAAYAVALAVKAAASAPLAARLGPGGLALATSAAHVASLLVLSIPFMTLRRPSAGLSRLYLAVLAATAGAMVAAARVPGDGARSAIGRGIAFIAAYAVLLAILAGPGALRRLAGRADQPRA